MAGLYRLLSPILTIYLNFSILDFVLDNPSFLTFCRVAEEVIFGEDNVTTGASNDFMQVSRVARQMVERFGFSKKIGQIAVGGSGGNPFFGQQVCTLLLC